MFQAFLEIINMIESMNQRMTEWMNQWFNESMTEWINKSKNESMYLWMIQSIEQSSRTGDFEQFLKRENFFWLNVY
jgi:hypothetical protein